MTDELREILRTKKILRSSSGVERDVTELWIGGRSEASGNSSCWMGDFNARPSLADDILPAWSELAESWTDDNIRQSVIAFRNFFRFLDQYESAFPGQLCFDSITEAVGFIWRHPLDNRWKAAGRHAFSLVGKVLRHANTLKHGPNHRFSWPVQEDKARKGNQEKDLPTRDEARAAITLLKREAYAIFARWRRADQLAATGRNLLDQPYSPRTGFGFSVTEADLHATYRAIIERTGICMPDFKEIRQALGLPPGARLPNSWGKAAHGIKALREGVYPTSRDLHCLSQLFMARTGWNPSTVYSLDVTNPDWATSYGTPERDLWLLESWKDRSSEWQQTICRGRVETGPYAIVRALIERTRRLREGIGTGSARIAVGADPSAILRSAWVGVCDGSKHRGRVSHIHSKIAGSAAYWHAAVDAYNCEVEKLNAGVDEENKRVLAAAPQDPGGAPSLRKKFTRIPTSMVPSDWRDIYADFVFVDSRYAWVVVQWALGHKHIITTRHYLRRKLWRRFSEDKLLSVQVAVTDELRHGRLDALIIRARVEFAYIATEDDIKRVDENRRRVRESELTYSGYLCPIPRNPPPEIDSGNPSDGTMLCRRGERCPGCPAAIAMDAFHMVKRQVELELLQREMSVSVWMDSHLASDLDVLRNDLEQWPPDEIAQHREYWLSEFESGRRLLNPWSSRN